jgi:hypothetical protein
MAMRMGDANLVLKDTGAVTSRKAKQQDLDQLTRFEL